MSTGYKFESTCITLQFNSKVEGKIRNKDANFDVIRLKIKIKELTLLMTFSHQL